jgi:hypothetical protein
MKSSRKSSSGARGLTPFGTALRLLKKGVRPLAQLEGISLLQKI